MMEFVRRSMLEMTCPEGRGKTELLLEWGTKGDRETLNGAYCKNPALTEPNANGPAGKKLSRKHPPQVEVSR